MKLVYITQYYPPHLGGLEYVARMQAERAVRAGHDVSVVTCAVAGTSKGTTVEEGVTVHRVANIDFFEKRFGIPFALGGVGLVRAVVRAVKVADIVHLHDVFYITSLVGYCAARWYKKPLMLTQHVGIVPHSSRIVVAAQRIVYALWGRRIFRASRHIVTYQTTVHDFLITQGVEEEKIVRAHNGVDLDVFTPVSEAEKIARRKELGLPVTKTLVLFVGRMVPKKGYRVLFDARGGEYDIVFVGPGRVPARWHTTPGVHMLGARTPEELAYLYPAMDILAAPSQGEMFTVVMQEALASGLPLVIADSPAYASYNLDFERITLCEPTSQALRAAVCRIAADPTLQAAMGQYSRSLAETYFNWDKNIEPILRIYDTIYHTGSAAAPHTHTEHASSTYLKPASPAA